MKICIHPRRAYNLMKDFLNTASDLMCVYDDNDYEKTEITLRKGDFFCAESWDCVADCEELTIYYNFNNLWDNGAKLFRSYWTKKEPMLKGFSNIVIALLHELGHLETSDEVRKVFPFEMRKLTLLAIDEKCSNNDEKNWKYFSMFDESEATEWGIEWLKNANNRKIAKEFEKKFFACFI